MFLAFMNSVGTLSLSGIEIYIAQADFISIDMDFIEWGRFLFKMSLLYNEIYCKCSQSGTGGSKHLKEEELSS